MTNTNNIIPIDRSMVAINALADLARNLRRDLDAGYRISPAQVENRIRDYCEEDPSIEEIDIQGMITALTRHPAFINRLS